jgi:hypothetical protein
MIRDALKVILLVNASIAVAFGVFYEMVKLCNQIGISPWWIAALYVVSFAAWWWKQCWEAPYVKG